MPPKRSNPVAPLSRQVRTKIGGSHASSASVEERAEPFRLATVKFPIDDMNACWSMGSNRDLDHKHAQQLCRLFEEHGLQRRAPSNRIRLLCHAADVEAMRAHLHFANASNGSDHDLPDFVAWSAHASDSAEILAGNHRVHALRAYLDKHHATDTSERWWVCDIYDKDTLPIDLQIELRANRAGTVLPDTHGQIWSELITCAEHDSSGKLFSGVRHEVEARMSQALQLSGREPFPVRRLAILFKNERWKPFISQLCERKAGKDMFNISVFQKLASYRIDDFIFELIEAVMEPIRRIWEHCQVDLELEQYQRIADLPQPWQPLDLFYPKCLDAADVNRTSPRRSRFLAHIDDRTYFVLYTYLVEHGREFSFPNAVLMLKGVNMHGKTMQLVMTHVAMWVNPNFTKVHDREGNKPPLVDDLLPVMSTEPDPTSPDDTPPAKLRAFHLQRVVLTYVKEHAASFTDAAHQGYLGLWPDVDVEPDVYRERFTTAPWREVLLRVHDAVGTCLSNRCVPGTIGVTPPATSQLVRQRLVKCLLGAVTHHPDIVGNPSLSDRNAMTTLHGMVEDVITRWTAEYSTEATPSPNLQRGMLYAAVSKFEAARFRSVPLEANIPPPSAQAPPPIANATTWASPTEQPWPMDVHAVSVSLGSSAERRRSVAPSETLNVQAISVSEAPSIERPCSAATATPPEILESSPHRCQDSVSDRMGHGSTSRESPPFWRRKNAGVTVSSMLNRIPPQRPPSPRPGYSHERLSGSVPPTDPSQRTSTSDIPIGTRVTARTSGTQRAPGRGGGWRSRPVARA